MELREFNENIFGDYGIEFINSKKGIYKINNNSNAIIISSGTKIQIKIINKINGEIDNLTINTETYQGDKKSQRIEISNDYFYVPKLNKNEINNLIGDLFNYINYWK